MHVNLIAILRYIKTDMGMNFNFLFNSFIYNTKNNSEFLEDPDAPE